MKGYTSTCCIIDEADFWDTTEDNVGSTWVHHRLTLVVVTQDYSNFTSTKDPNRIHY